MDFSTGLKDNLFTQMYLSMVEIYGGSKHTCKSVSPCISAYYEKNVNKQA